MPRHLDVAATQGDRGASPGPTPAHSYPRALRLTRFRPVRPLVKELLELLDNPPRATPTG
jgi:hypothetical protein